jgi:hypothetical protein
MSCYRAVLAESSRLGIVGRIGLYYLETMGYTKRTGIRGVGFVL